MRPRRSTFWADVRRDYASIWPSMRNGFLEAREHWREIIAEIRQQRQLTRRMKERITGIRNPTRRQWREGSRVVLDEVRELEGIEQRVLREFRENGTAS
jgi:hypothetical protein